MTVLCSKCLGPMREIGHCDKCSPDFEGLLREYFGAVDALKSITCMGYMMDTSERDAAISRARKANDAARAALKRGKDG
jgi:hypothetical protein